MDGRAAEKRIVRVVEVAVGRVRIEQLRHLVDEPLEDGLEPQLARHDLGGFEERGLLLEALRVLVEQLRGVDRDSQFACDGLGERDLRIRPWARLRRDGARRSRSSCRTRGPASRGRRGCRALARSPSRRASDRSSADSSRMSPTATVLRSRAARLETASRSAAAPIGANPGAVHSAAIGIGPLGSPSLRKQRLTPVAEPVASTATLQHVVEVELGPHLPADRRNEPLTLERIGQRVGRAAPDRVRAQPRRRAPAAATTRLP